MHRVGAVRRRALQHTNNAWLEKPFKNKFLSIIRKVINNPRVKCA